MVAPLSLENLSTEILLKIFNYLDIKDLCKLKQTCKRIKNVVDTWAHSLIKSDLLLVTNQVHTSILNRSCRILTPFEKFRISRNWKRGIYSEKSLLYSRIRYIPWLQLNNKFLWISRAQYVTAYRRTYKGIAKNPICNLTGKSDAEVCRFLFKDNCILSGQTDGSMWMWSVDREIFIFDQANCHDDDINSVDMIGDVIVSGSKDTSVKIWRKSLEDLSCTQTISLTDRVWTVALSDNQSSQLAIGTAATANCTPLYIYDLMSNQLLLNTGTNRFGAGILDITWESPSILWTSGYDANLRRWDLRTGNCEQSLEDPCESTIYCFEHDRVNTIITGTQSNGRVVLWDTRYQNYVQMYFMNSCRNRDKSSPVYSLSFDAECLFTATHQNVNILDFSVSTGRFRDYSNLFIKLIKC